MVDGGVLAKVIKRDSGTCRDEETGTLNDPRIPVGFKSPPREKFEALHNPGDTGERSPAYAVYCAFC